MASWEQEDGKKVDLSNRQDTSFLKFFWDVNPLFKNKNEGIGHFLKEVTVLDNFSDWELFTLSKFFHKRNFSKNEVVFSEGEFGLGFYLLFNGRISIFAQIDNRDLEVAKLEKGDFFGEMSLLEQDGKRTATAIASEDCVLLALFQPDLNEITERYPTIAAKFYQTMALIIADRLKRVSIEARVLKKDMLELKAKIQHED